MSASIRNSYSLRKEFTLKERIKCTYIKSPASGIRQYCFFGVLVAVVAVAR